MPTSYIVDSISGCKISNYQNECIVLTTHVPVVGCGAFEARIWRVSIDESELEYGDTRDPLIISISNL